MAHKVIIDGTAYSVKSGKTLIDGTGYSIKKGRTLIDGTVYSISFVPDFDPVFANNDWATIIKVCQANAVPSTWAADGTCYKNMTINGKSYRIDIIGKNQDTYTTGGTAPLTFQLHDQYASAACMTSSNTNAGGYDSTQMHTTTLPSILALMPSEVQTGIRAVNKLSSAGSISSTIETVSCKLFLLAEKEILGSTAYSFSGEGSQYTYYSAGNSKVKSGSTSPTWWTRSPSYNCSSNFVVINSSGTSAQYGGYNSMRGIAFAFCF